tara:strand:- start:76 stop:1008 length:933 start_codon:yes stop_codon:yes gene_type:complete
MAGCVMINAQLLAQSYTDPFSAAGGTEGQGVDNVSSSGQSVGSISEEAFSEIPDDMFPVSLEQVKEIRRLYNETMRASTFQYDTPPRPTTSNFVLDLSPGSVPPVIRLLSGYVSSLQFFDSTNQPWPIKAYDMGNASSFNIQTMNDSADDPANMSNSLLIQAVTMYREANMVIMLEGLNTPIFLQLIPGQQTVDYRVEIIVPRNGPNAKYDSTMLPEEVSPVLRDFLHYMPPLGAVKLSVEGASDATNAWLFNNMMYLRTDLDVVSPGWVSRVTHTDGETKVYELNKTPLVLATKNGRQVKLTLEMKEGV